MTIFLLPETSHLVQTAETDRLVIGSEDQSSVGDDELEGCDISGGGENPATVREILHPPGETVVSHLGVGVEPLVALTHSLATQ